jgi:hypothetical protein
MSLSGHKSVMFVLLSTDEGIPMSSKREQFPHRQNSNGTYDSICPKCFRTIDTRHVEGALAGEERVHICCQDDLLPRDMFDTENRDPA